MNLIERPSPPAAERQAPARRIAAPRQPDPPATTGVARPRYRRRLQTGVLVTLMIAAGIGGTLWWLNARDWIGTDDAFIDAHMVQISPQVAGRVARVLVRDNQEVAAGQPLLDLESADFAARLDQARANQKSAAGTLAQAQAQLALAQTNRNELQAEIGVAKANATNAAIDLQRYQRLGQIDSAALSRQQLDNATAAARSSAANLTAAQLKVVAADAQVTYARTQIETATAGAQAAAAQFEQAWLDLSYTRLAAPAAGHIAQKSVTIGDYVQIGQDLMALVPNQVWVTANFKETDLNHMRIGQPVEIEVDAFPGKIFHGHIDSFQAGSGAAFSLLPPENATGNYIKVVQRVPVKIVFDDPPGTIQLLGPGMSVVPYVKIR